MGLAIHLQERDLALLRELLESRIMTIAHISALHFQGKKEAAKKRLQKLKAAGLISERRRRMYEPAILSLTRTAFVVLKEHGILAQYPTLSTSSLEKRTQVSGLTIHHELEVMDVKAAFHTAIKGTHNLSNVEFSTWPLLHQFKALSNGRGGEILVKPDGFIRIHEREGDGSLSEIAFFLEVDRSSETQDTLVARAGCYLDYYKSGGYALRCGGSRDQCKEYPFRVLIICKTAERRNNTAERLLQNNPPILTMVCLSTLEEVRTNPLGPVWITPAAYRDALNRTSFDTKERRESWGYRRQTEREILVEQKIQKSELLFSAS